MKFWLFWWYKKKKKFYLFCSQTETEIGSEEKKAELWFFGSGNTTQTEQMISTKL